MLQTIRETTQGWIAGIIISIICLTFALWGIHSYFVGGKVNNTVAEVNGTEISKQELNSAYERLRRQNQQQFNKPAKVNDAELKKEALNNLVELEVLKQASVSAGYLVSDQQVDAYLQSMPEFQVNGEFSLDKFQQTISSSLMSTGEFLELIKNSLQIDQPRLGISLTSFATPQEVKSLMSLVDQERDVDYLLIANNEKNQDKVVVTQEDIKQYYNSHKNTFMSPEQVRVKYVELTLNDLAAKIKPTDAMLQKYYDENLSAYTKPMAWQLQEIRIPFQDSKTEASAKAEIVSVSEELDKGASFDDYAKKHQSDQSYIGEHMVTLTMLPVDLQNPVSQLLKSGAYTKPIKTTDAFVILRAANVRAASVDKFADVKRRVTDDYVRQHSVEKLAELRERLADLAYEQPDSLGAVSDQLGLPVKTSAHFSKNKGEKDISQYKKVREIAFTTDVLEMKNNSDVIQLTPESMAVIRIDEHKTASLKPLSAVEGEIVSTLKKQRLEEKSKAQADGIFASLEKGASMDDVASKNKLKWKKAGYLSRYSVTVDSAILDKAFQLPNPLQGKLKVSYGVAKVPNGYAVVALKSIKDGETTDKQKLGVFAEQAQNSEGTLEYLLYKDSQMAKAKVKLTQK